MNEALTFVIVFLVVSLIVMIRAAVIVPQQMAYVVERLGRFTGVLHGGFYLIWPFVDRVRYRLSLKETVMDIAEQVCITRDNVQIAVDGILYFKVTDPERAAYGVNDFIFAITQLAQTTMRSEFGKLDLDNTFLERSQINARVVHEVDKVTEPWGVKVLRYEIRDIRPPKDILAAMEKQMRAEREKRAVILASEGERDAEINAADGRKQQVIRASEAKKQQQINEAEGAAEAILTVARATAAGLSEVAGAIDRPGGAHAMDLRVAEQYVAQFGKIARASTTMIVPANAADVASMVAIATRVARASVGEAVGKSGAPEGEGA